MLQKIVIGVNTVAVISSDFLNIIKTIFLLTKPFGHTPVINGVYWSLTCEFFFYLIIGLSLIIGLKKNLLLCLSIISLLSIIIRPELSDYLFWIKYWHSFALGITIYYFHLVKKPIYILVLFLCCVIGLYHFHLSKGYYPYVVATYLSAILIYISPFLNNFLPKKIQLLGDLSYSIYLIHIPVGVFIFGLIKNSFIQSYWLPNILFDSFVYVTISLVSYFIYNYFENPAMVYGKKFIKSYLTKISSE